MEEGSDNCIMYMALKVLYGAQNVSPRVKSQGNQFCSKVRGSFPQCVIEGIEDLERE